MNQGTVDTLGVVAAPDSLAGRLDAEEAPSLLHHALAVLRSHLFEDAVDLRGELVELESACLAGHLLPPGGGGDHSTRRPPGSGSGDGFAEGFGGLLDE